MRTRLFAALVLLLLSSLPVSAADRVIQSGIDLWSTPADGKTFADFSRNPIPAGFFCYNSAPFNGRIVFRGIPVATGEKGALGKTDTIVHRLDDAVFNKRGVAVTRIQMRVLHLESVQPIKTSCGAFNVEVRLNGEQPITRMRIVRESDTGGRFYAPIAINSKLVFRPAGRASNEILEISRNVRFPATQGIKWAGDFGNRGVQRPGFVLVDTDNDRLPDTYLSGTSSNFAAGWPRTAVDKVDDMPPSCHFTPEETHCTSAP